MQELIQSSTISSANGSGLRMNRLHQKGNSMLIEGLQYDKVNGTRARERGLLLNEANLTAAAIGNDRFSVVTTLLGGSVSVGSAGRSGRAGSWHANGNRFLVQTDFETHAHVLLVVKQPDRILSIVGSSILHSSIALRFTGRRILLQVTIDDLASSAEEPLKIPCTCFVVDVADEDSANFSLDHTMADVDVGSCWRRNIDWSLGLALYPGLRRRLLSSDLLSGDLLSVCLSHSGSNRCHSGRVRRVHPHTSHAGLQRLH